MVVLFLIFWGISILFSIVVGSLWKFLIFVSIWFYLKSQYKVSGTGIKVTITYSNNYASLLFCPLLLLPSILPSITIFSSELVLRIRWQSWSWKFQWIFKTERDDRGWDNWMASPTQWTWVWARSRSWWWTGRPGMLQSFRLQRVRHDRATELNQRRFPTSSAPQVKPRTRVTLVQQVGSVLQCKTSEMKSGSLYRLQVAFSVSVVVNLCSLVICISLECKYLASKFEVYFPLKYKYSWTEL